MAAKAWIWFAPLLLICGIGCSTSDVPTSSATPSASVAPRPLASAVATVVLPAPAPAVPPAKEASEPGFVPPFPENIDMFAPPKAPAAPAKPEPEKNTEPAPAPSPVAAPALPEKKLRPPLRLVGFVNVGSPKALLSLNGKLSAVQTGETLEEVEVLAVEPPSVTLKFDSDEYSINLLERSPEGVRTSMLPTAHGTRGAAAGTSSAPVVPRPAEVSSPTPTPPPPPPVATIAVAAEQPPSVPPVPNVETADPPPLPALPGALPVNSLRDLPKLP